MNQGNNLVVDATTAVHANQFKVEVDQVWKDTDARRPRQVRVISVDLARGVARVQNTETERCGQVRLERFSPANHMRIANASLPADACGGDGTYPSA